jgi:hypothetical protein
MGQKWEGPIKQESRGANKGRKRAKEERLHTESPKRPYFVYPTLFP